METLAVSLSTGSWTEITGGSTEFAIRVRGTHRATYAVAATAPAADAVHVTLGFDPALGNAGQVLGRTFDVEAGDKVWARALTEGAVIEVERA